jgi:cytochrome c oxidase assembly protein subunit 15
VCVQGAFGAWTVTLKLQPIIVTIHLLLGMSLLALLTWHALRQSEHLPVADVSAGLRIPAVLALFAAFMQIALGGWVSTNYAALACGGFPLCQGSWMPTMDFTHGFTLWRALGMTAAGDYLPFDALVAIHWVHRLFSVVVVGLVAWIAHRAWKTPGTERLGRGLLWLILLQFCTGMATVLLSWPLTIAVLHNAGAALLVLLLTMLNYRFSQPVEKAAEFRASHSPA